MVKDKELFTLQEDNRLLAKQFRQKKDAQKRREKLLQVYSLLLWGYTVLLYHVCFIGTNYKTRTGWEWPVWKC